jgi:predicted transcriptional regulator
MINKYRNKKRTIIMRGIDSKIANIEDKIKMNNYKLDELKMNYKVKKEVFEEISAEKVNKLVARMMNESAKIQEFSDENKKKEFVKDFVQSIINEQNEDISVRYKEIALIPDELAKLKEKVNRSNAQLKRHINKLGQRSF